MKTLKLKIHSYNTENNSLIVSFCSDESLNQPDSYPKIAFQPGIYTDSDNAETEINKIAQRGVSMAKEQDEQEQRIVDQNKINYYSSLVGETLTFSVSGSDIFDPNTMDLTNIIIPGQ